MATDDGVRIWYDGDCELCRRSRAWCEVRATPSRLRFIDFRALPDGQLPVPRSELESSIWVKTDDGDFLRGFDAWRQVLLAVPRWRWLAWLSGIPPLRWIGPPFYHLVARVRNLISAPEGPV